MQLPSLSNSKHFITPEQSRLPMADGWAVTLPFPFSPDPANHQFAFCLGISLFWIYHVKGVIQYVTFCVWLLSLSVMFSRLTRCGVCRARLLLVTSSYSLACVPYDGCVSSRADRHLLSSCSCSARCHAEHVCTRICLRACFSFFWECIWEWNYWAIWWLYI